MKLRLRIVFIIIVFIMKIMTFSPIAVHGTMEESITEVVEKKKKKEKERESKNQ